ncbi:MAG: NAD(P)-dependent alcohol dehydrogenase [Coriobacteriia bacterium]|jgi:threonine dehydrogenase-like Zn-dependent dehydrogenase|nr:NAD(P)-dependent alcohol dehydrogenase [Coriobacteriia bacterium]
MKAFAMLGLNKTGWIEKDRPACGPNDAILRPIALAPCTSDVHTVWEGAIGDRKDLILGHEGVGEIVEVGELVRDFKVGDVCIVPAITPDWNSVEAQDGYQMHSGGMLGGWKFSNIKDGMFAEFFHVNDADGNLALLPEGLSPETATMLSDMVPTGFHAAELAGVRYGDNVVVVGIGPVGLMAVRGAVLKGAARIFAVGTRPNCVAVAKEYGATDIINYKNGSIVDQVMELTGGAGVDKVLQAGGTVDTFDESIRMLKPGGAIGNVNYLGSGEFIKIPREEWGVGMGHKMINAGLMPGGRRRMERLADMVLAGRVDPSKLLTHRFEGFDSIEEALMLMKDKPADLIKPVVSIKW